MDEDLMDLQDLVETEPNLELDEDTRDALLALPPSRRQAAARQLEAWS